MSEKFTITVPHDEIVAAVNGVVERIRQGYEDAELEKGTITIGIDVTKDVVSVESIVWELNNSETEVA